MDFAGIYRKESIIFSTIEVLDEFGIMSLSTKEIAKRQGIAESTIFRYFPTKDDLLNAVLDYYTLYDDDMFKTTKLNDMKPRDAILYYIDLRTTYYENYPAISVITQIYDALRFRPALTKKVQTIYSSRNEFILKMIEDAKLTGEIRMDINSNNLADIINSLILGMCLSWRMNGYNFSLRERTLESINLLLDTFCI